MAMIIILATWLICITTFFGIGLLARLVLVGRSEPTGLTPFACAWCGFSLSIGILQIWHLVLPINSVATMSLIIVGLWGIVSSANEVRKLFRHVAREKKLVVAFIIFAVWAANRGLGEGGYDDIGYEWPSVHWIGKYSIVPGLANLNQRFGFNNAHHLLAASMNFGPLEGRVNHALLGTFVILLAAQILWALGCFSRGRLPKQGFLFTLAFIAPCFVMLLFGMFGPMFSTLKADILIIAAALAAVSLLVNSMDRSPVDQIDKSVPNDSAFILFTVVVLGAAIVTVKLSALIFSMGLMIAAVLITRDRHFRIRRAVIVAAFAVASVLLATWLIRGGIISGYPLYPSRMITLPVSWRVMPSVADGEYTFIKSWGRDSATATRDALVLASRPWVIPWLSNIMVNDKFTTVLPTALFIAAAPFAIRGMLRFRDHPIATGTLGIVVVISIVSIFYWFISAPTTRFGYGFFWTAAGATLAMAMPYGLHETSVRRNAAIAVGAGLLLIICAGFVTLLPLPRGTRSGFLAFAGAVAILIPMLCYLVSIDSKKSILVGLCLLGVSPLIERGVAHIFKGRMPELARFLFVSPGADGGFHSYSRQDTVVTPSDDEENPYVRPRDPKNIASGFKDARMAETP